MALSPALSFELKSIEPVEGGKVARNGSYSCVSSIDDEFKRETSCSLPSHQFAKWRRAALGISACSIFIELVLGTAGLVLAIRWTSPSAFGFSVDSFLDVITTLVVIWRYSGDEGVTYSWARERRAVICIAALFCASGICIAAKAIFNLVRERQPYAPYSLFGIAVAGMFTLSFLVWGKMVVAEKLQSKSLRVDAINTGCGAVMAFMLVASLVVYHYTKYWFVDSSVAIIIAIFLFVFGARTLFQMLFPVDLLAEPF